MKKLLSLFLAAGLVSLASVVKAQYVSTGPYGGALHSFCRESTNPNILAVGSGGIYQSTNEGSRWQELAAAPNVFNCDVIHSVATAPGLILAGSRQSGIFHSFDGGASWMPSFSGLLLSANAPYTDIEIIGPNALAIRADSGYLFFSSNQGLSWSRHNAVVFNGFAQYLSVHNNDIFVTTLQGLYKSTNNGTLFTNVNSSITNFGKPFWVNDTLYVATNSGIKMSTDDGANFTTVGLSGRAVRSVAVSGSNMYAVVRNPAPIQDSVLYSTNGGVDFFAAPFDDSKFRFTVVHDLMPTPSGVLVGTDYGVYSTTNNGSSWGRSDSGYNATSIRGLAVSGGYVLAAAAPMGVYRVKPDSGALDWQHSGDIARNVDGAMQCISAKGAFVHAGGAKGYYRSTDSGATWTAGTTGVSGGNVSAIHAQQASSDVWMVRNGNLHYSSDDGASFGQVVNSGIPPGIALGIYKADTALFVSAYGALYKGGSTMSFNLVSGITGFVTGVVHLGGTFYASTFGSGMFSSADGASWLPVTIAPPAVLHANINALTTHGTDLMAATDDGIYSNQSGDWMLLDLPGRVVQSLVIRNGKLFAGTCSGVYSMPYKLILPPNGIPSARKEAGSLQIWPNPSSGNVTLAFNAANGGNLDISLSDVTGRELAHRSANSKNGHNTLLFSISDLHLPAGIYLVQLKGRGYVATGRLVIK